MQNLNGHGRPLARKNSIIKIVTDTSDHYAANRAILGGNSDFTAICVRYNQHKACSHHEFLRTAARKETHDRYRAATTNSLLFIINVNRAKVIMPLILEL